MRALSEQGQNRAAAAGTTGEACSAAVGAPPEATFDAFDAALKLKVEK